MEKTVKKEKSKNVKTLLAGIVAENPVLVGLLGMCPTLATTKSFESALGMGILVILVLMGSNVLISLLRNIIPADVKIPCYIVIIATFVTVIKMLAEAYLPELYSSLGVFISLIVYIKEYQPDGLHSHNPRYKTIFTGEGVDVRCCGRVTGPVAEGDIATGSLVEKIEAAFDEEEE